ncbi:hypothetical protein E2C01_076483 [Portunus trituberculatus]|uniref:Uncharacterized protein n=1 Tax=Portunus trituberculatus TaxID=210409 RepID=A0A5B7IJV9_PORTR|nr:hypothetical protein [Portunus trituberculatus]
MSRDAAQPPGEGYKCVAATCGYNPSWAGQPIRSARPSRRPRADSRLTQYSTRDSGEGRPGHPSPLPCTCQGGSGGICAARLSGRGGAGFPLE